MKILYATVLLCFLCLPADAQSTFKKSYGGSGNEQGVWMDMLADGSFAVCGRTTTNSNGGWDALLAKFSPDGNIEWSNGFGSGQDDYLNVVKSTADGGFVVTGTTYLSGTGGDLLAAKVDAGGNIVWQKHFGTSSTVEEGRGICVLPDGFLFCGYSGASSSPLVYFVKTDFDGNLVWANTGPTGIAAEAVIASNGELWVSAGYSGDGTVIRLNGAGNVLGVLQLSGAGNEALYYIKSAGNEYLVSDHSWVPSGNTQQRPWVVKLNNSGGVVWSKSYSLGAAGRALAEATSDGGAIFSLYNFGATSAQAIMVKINAAGEVSWAKLHTYPVGNSGILHHVKEAPGGGFVAVGFCNIAGNGTDLIVLKTDALGNIAGCCPVDFSVTVQAYNPAQINPSPSLVDLTNNNQPSFTATSISLTEIDRCNGPSCCITDAGTMQATSQTVCVGQPANFAHNGNQILDNNDLLRYILFSNPADTLGSIVATSATPSFAFNSATMQTGVTYYAAAIAGNNLNGNVDLNDPCLDVSNAAEVVWRPLPTVALSVADPKVCAGACTDLTATFTGTAPFTLTYTTPASGTVTQTFSGNSGIFQVCTLPGAPPGSWWCRRRGWWMQRVCASE